MSSPLITNHPLPLPITLFCFLSSSYHWNNLARLLVYFLVACLSYQNVSFKPRAAPGVSEQLFRKYSLIEKNKLPYAETKDLFVPNLIDKVLIWILSNIWHSWWPALSLRHHFPWCWWPCVETLVSGTLSSSFPQELLLLGPCLTYCSSGSPILVPLLLRFHII